MYDLLDKLSPGWQEPHIKSLGGPFGRKKVEEFLEKISDLPDYADNDDSVVASVR